MLLKISVLVIGTAKVKAPSTYTSAQLSWLEKAVKKFFTGFLVRTYYLLTKFMQFFSQLMNPTRLRVK